MTPHWYDLLDVHPAASPEEVRAAWKAGIADLEPDDRRFKVYNEAAAVLLDPERRAAYDATLAAEADADADASETTAEPEPARGSVVVDTEALRARRQLPLWLVAAVALLAIAAVVATIFAWTRPAPVDEARAQAAAETAIVPVLSYDYQSLDADAAAARSYMTDSYRKKYDETFALVQDNAGSTQTVVTVEVVASGIVRTGEDRVDVLLFVNRPTTNKQAKEPVVYRDQVTARMQLVDGTWLVDDLITTPAAR